MTTWNNEPTESFKEQSLNSVYDTLNHSKK